MIETQFTALNGIYWLMQLGISRAELQQWLGPGAQMLSAMTGSRHSNAVIKALLLVGVGFVLTKAESFEMATSRLKPTSAWLDP